MKSEILSVEIEKKLSEKYAEPVKIRKSVPVSGGCIHHATRLETTAGDFFLKWNNSGSADIFIREAEGLQELSKVKSQNLFIPEVILSSFITDIPGYLLLEYLQPTTGNQHAEFALGRGLAEIHRFGGVSFGFIHDNYCGSTKQNNKTGNSWIKFYGENRILFLLELIKKEGGFSARDTDLIERLVSRLPSILPADCKPVLIHGDLWSGNYMICSKGPALIDPAVYYADREMEFGILTLFGGFSRYFWQGYTELNPMPDGWKDRNPVYQFYHLLNHFYLFGGSYGSQALSIARYFAG